MTAPSRIQPGIEVADEIADLKKANEILRALLTNREAEIDALRQSSAPSSASISERCAKNEADFYISPDGGEAPRCDAQNVKALPGEDKGFALAQLRVALTDLDISAYNAAKWRIEKAIAVIESMSPAPVQAPFDRDALIEQCALIAEGFDASCDSPRMKLFVDAGLVIAIYKRDGEIGQAIRALSRSSTGTKTPRPFYGAECPSYPNCDGGCGLGCTKEIEQAKAARKGNRFCAHDDCPYPDCLVGGICPSQPSTGSNTP
jgi:hypothetical protein